MTVAIVTDSAAAVPQPLAAECGITVVPMWLVSDGEAVREGERTLGELLGDARITTSAPTPGEFEDAIRSALERGASDVLVLTIASAMSASHDAAAVAVRDVGEHARVVDTMTAAGAQALVVLAAARAANAGLSLDDVARVATDVAARVRLVATVPDLEHLVRSGRVPGIAGWAGRTLGLSPLFEFRTGKVHRLRPARGRRRLRPAGRTLPSGRRPRLSPARGRAPRPRPRGRAGAARPSRRRRPGGVVHQRVRLGDGRARRPRSRRPGVVVGTGQSRRVTVAITQSTAAVITGSAASSCACHAPGTRSSRRGSAAAS